jgi:UDP-GlcNAc:undecaprenyl-phosphate GlcNAc-1-phosphate transferase
MTYDAIVATIGPAATAAVLALIVTPIVRALAHRTRIVATPKKDRWSVREVALLGGVAIVAAVTGTALLWRIFDGPTALVFGAAAAMFAVGLYDDYIRLKPNTKLIAQLAVASALVALGNVLPVTGSAVADQLITIFWFVSITNAFNLLDNMDGLCGSVALVVAASCWLSLAVGGDAGTSPAILATALAGALAGFLVYNFQPASIFMGDSGSLFVGFLLAGMTTVAAEAGRTTASAVVWPALIMLIPIFDTTLVTVSRKLSGRAASAGGTDHTSHRLVALGYSERSAVLILTGLAAAGGGAAVTFRAFGLATSSVLVAVLLLATLLLAVVLARVRVYQDQDFAALRQGTFTPLLVEFMYKRRILEVLLDFGLVVLSYWAAYRLRWEGETLERNLPYFVQSLPLVVAFQITGLFASGVYRGTWRYFGLHDIGVYLRGVLSGSLGIIIWLLYSTRFEGYSRSVFVIDAMILTLLLIGARTSFRAIGEYGSRERGSGRRVVIYGAGDGGALVVRELLNNPNHGFRPIGFLDDEASKINRKIHGLPVLGGVDALEGLIVDRAMDTVIVSTGKVRPDRLARLVRLCGESETPLIRMEFSLKPLATDPAAHWEGAFRRKDA